MDIATLVQKVYDLIAAVRNGNYMQAIMLTLELIRIISSVLPTASLATTRSNGLKASFYSDKSLDQLCDELDECCKAAPTRAAGSVPITVGAAPTGPFIDAALPILIALLRKLIGV